MFSWHTVGFLIPIINHCLNATAYFGTVAANAHLLKDTIHSFSNGYFQLNNATNWFHDHDSGLQWPPQSPDPNPVCLTGTDKETYTKG